MLNEQSERERERDKRKSMKFDLVDEEEFIDYDEILIVFLNEISFVIVDL